METISMTMDYEAIRAKLFGHFRFAVFAWLVALPAMVLPLVWMQSQGLMPQDKWPMILACPFLAAALMLGSFYATIAWTLHQARRRLTASNG